MVKVKATIEYQKNNVQDSELKRVPQEGEIFEVSEERLHTLQGNNPFRVSFVEEIKETKKMPTTKVEEDKEVVIEKKAFIKDTKKNVKKSVLQK